MTTQNYACPRCGRGLATTNEKHDAAGMSCRDKARCPACGQVAFVNADGRMAGHKAWSGVRVDRCPGVGQPPEDPDDLCGGAGGPAA